MSRKYAIYDKKEKKYVFPYGNKKSFFFPRLHETVAYCTALNYQEVERAVRASFEMNEEWDEDPETQILFASMLKYKETSKHAFRYFIRRFGY